MFFQISNAKLAKKRLDILWPKMFLRVHGKCSFECKCLASLDHSLFCLPCARRLGSSRAGNIKCFSPRGTLSNESSWSSAVNDEFLLTYPGESYYDTYARNFIYLNTLSGFDSYMTIRTFDTAKFSLGVC
jgi:hypothetical protein